MSLELSLDWLMAALFVGLLVGCESPYGADYPGAPAGGQETSSDVASLTIEPQPTTESLDSQPAPDDGGMRAVPFRIERYVSFDKLCVTVEGAALWDPAKRPRGSYTLSDLDDLVREGANIALFRQLTKANRAKSIAMGTRLGAGLLSVAREAVEGYGITVTKVRVTRVMKCDFAIRVVTIPKAQYLSRNKRCIELAAKVWWDPAIRPPTYLDKDLPKLDRMVIDHALGELRLAAAMSSRAEMLANATTSFQTNVARRVRNTTKSYPLGVTKLRIHGAAKCHRPRP